MDTYLREARSVQTQRVVQFTGEGAYHGSTKPRAPITPKPAPPPPVEEMIPTTLDAYAAAGKRDIDHFEATFTNRLETKAILPTPSQREIMNDGVTFCWCPIDVARQQAGPLTKRVLEAMSDTLDGCKRHVYIDSKIQYFEAGDLPVDSQHWHVDGSIVARDARVQEMGYPLLHDMKARMQRPAIGPKYLSYQSSEHCATLFAAQPLTLQLPELIQNFDELDRLVRRANHPAVSQPAASIVSFDGLSLHRAVVARDAGWRLWVRCVETDREVHLTSSIIQCYGTVFRTG